MDQDTILVSSLLIGGAAVIFAFIVAAVVFTGPMEEGSVRTFPQLKAGADAHAGGHPTEKQYVMVGIVLALITAAEVGLYYVTGISNNALVPTLIVMSAAKFLLVVMWFMHLRFDNRLFSTLFMMGLVTAVIVFLLALIMLRSLIPGDLD